MFVPFIRNPFIFFSTDGEDGGGAGSEDLGFPADTKPEDMTPEQQLAYWQNESEKWKTHSKKHEKNRKPKTFDADMAELVALREKQDEGLKPDEKAAKDDLKNARKSGRDEGITELLVPAVRAEFRARAPHLSDEELDEFLDDIDVTASRFFTDGALNTDRIDRLASRIAKSDDSDDGDNDTAPKVTLGGILGREQGQKKVPGDSRSAAYERTKAKYQKSNPAN